MTVLPKYTGDPELLARYGPDPDELACARRMLSAFVRRQAELAAAELGFSWEPTSHAPSGLTELQAEFHTCHKTGQPLRVLKDFSDKTVFDCPATNWAMRYWHDTRHVWLGADFSTEAELSVASCHLAAAKQAGFGPGSLAYALLLADTVGQTLFVAHTRRFVVHQLEYALECVIWGIGGAIGMEVERCCFEDTAT